MIRTFNRIKVLVDPRFYTWSYSWKLATIENSWVSMITNRTDVHDSAARPYWMLDIRNCFYGFGERDYFKRILHGVFLLSFFV